MKNKRQILEDKLRPIIRKMIKEDIHDQQYKFTLPGIFVSQLLTKLSKDPSFDYDVAFDEDYLKGHTKENIALMIQALLRGKLIEKINL